MGFSPDRDRSQDAARHDVDRVNDIVVAPREPEHLATDAQVSDVGGAAAGNGPRAHDAPSGEVDDGNTPLPMRAAAIPLEPAVGHVELRPVATWIKAVRPDAGLDEPDLSESL